jgi:hypothetical protein
MPTTATPNLLQDPGYLFWAPLGSSEPTNTVAGSVFTDSWPVAWINLGATDDGSEFTSETTIEPVTVAELFDAVRYNTTGRTSKLAFALADITLANLKRVQNGGTLTVVSGTGATQLNKFTPPTPGNEVRSMVGWESLDATVRLIGYQCIQGGSTGLKNARRPAHASLAATFNMEVPSSGIPWALYTAGTARA